MTRKQALISIAVLCGILIVGIRYFKCYFYSSTKQLKKLNDYKALINEIAEVIIPRTNTPGSKDAKIADSIIRLAENCMSKRDRATLISGLTDLEAYSYKKRSSSFLNCSSKDQVAILQHFEEKATFLSPFLNRVKKRLWGASFFGIMKNLTVSCYCTSMLGATEGLRYDKIPVYYIGCLPFVQGQRSWALK